MEYCAEAMCSELRPCTLHDKARVTSGEAKHQAIEPPAIAPAAALAEPCPARLEDCEQMVLPNPAKWTLQGHSRAGERTGFWISPLKIVLDAGLTTSRLPNAIFITHPHVDHSWMLPWIFGCRTPLLTDADCAGLTGRPVFAPRSAWPMIEQLQRACCDLSHGKLGAEKLGSRINEAQKAHPFKCEAPRKDGSLGVCLTCPCDDGKIGNGYDDRHLTPGMREANSSTTATSFTASASPSDSSSSSVDSTWTMVPGGKGLKVEYLPCYHTAETVGFGFATTSTRLKAEYQGTPGKQLGELRKQGVELNEITLVPQLAFYGDTNVDAFRNHSQWEKYPVVVVECTLYPSLGKSEEVALQMGHMHWSSLAPIIKAHPSTFFVLIHHSLAMRMRDLADFETNIKTKEGFTNFVLWRG